MCSPSLSPHHIDELYIACDMSPEFPSTDFGKNWATLNFRQFCSNKWSAVRFTRDPKVLWSLDYTSPNESDACRPVRSTDGGKTWSKPQEQAWPVSRRAYVLFGDFAHHERAFVSAEYRELWVTQDGGKSYQRTYRTSNPGGLVLAGVFCDGETLYIGTNDGLLRSQDGGRTITKSVL